MDNLIDVLNILIGRCIEYDGVFCQVIDVLSEGPAIVLLMHDEKEIQTTQYGDASRHAPKTYTFPLVNDKTKEIHSLVQELLNADELAAVRELLKLRSAP